MGDDGGSGNQRQGAGGGLRPRKVRREEAEVARRQDRRRRGQEELYSDRRSLSRQARQGIGSARREDQEPDPRDQLTLMMRSALARISNHEARNPSLILRDAAKYPLLRMR